MIKKKNVLAIIGSASKNSANLVLVNRIAELTKEYFTLTIFDRLSTLPHFNPELSINDAPRPIIEFRELVLNSDGIIICTPEYVFSIPSGLKNAIEWCVSTTVFSSKPVGLITASAIGQKAHEELQLIMRTIEATFTEKTTLLIRGIKGKIDVNGNLSDLATMKELDDLILNYKELIDATGQ